MRFIMSATGKETGWVRTAFLKDDCVTAAKLADDAVTSAALADDSVDSAQLADDSVGADAFAIAVALVGLTANAEASNAIAVDIAVADLDGAAVTSAVILECYILDADGIEAVAADWTLAETGAGSEISNTAQSRLLIQTSAAGLAQVTVSDVSTAYAGDVYLVVKPIAVLGATEVEVLTFA